MPSRRRICSLSQATAPSSASAKGVADGEDSLKHHEQQREQDDRPERAVPRNSWSKSRMQAVTLAYFRTGSRCRRMAWAVRRRSGANSWGRGGAASRDSASVIARVSSASPLRRTATVGHHRHAKLALQRGRIDRQPVALRQIEHVERDHRRPAQLDHFEREDQMLFEVRGIEHHAPARRARPRRAAGRRMTLRVTSSSGLVGLRP